MSTLHVLRQLPAHLYLAYSIPLPLFVYPLFQTPSAPIENTELVTLMKANLKIIITKQIRSSQSELLTGQMQKHTPSCLDNYQNNPLSVQNLIRMHLNSTKFCSRVVHFGHF